MGMGWDGVGVDGWVVGMGWDGMGLDGMGMGMGLGGVGWVRVSPFDVRPASRWNKSCTAGWVSLAYVRVAPWWEGVYRCPVCARALSCAADVAYFAGVCAGVA